MVAGIPVVLGGACELMSLLEVSLYSLIGDFGKSQNKLYS